MYWRNVDEPAFGHTIWKPCTEENLLVFQNLFENEVIKSITFVPQHKIAVPQDSYWHILCCNKFQVWLNELF